MAGFARLIPAIAILFIIMAAPAAGNACAAEHISAWRAGITGKGVYTWLNGSRYEGDYLAGMRHGKGWYQWADGRSYQGDFKNDEVHGTGAANWPDGSHYEGEWRHNRRTGTGTLVYANGDRYTGRFLNDYPQGLGTMLYADGTQFTGLFEYGLPKEPAPVADGRPDSGNKTYSVAWLADGRVLIQWMNGDRYEGGFVASRFEGDGTYSFADGTSLTGNFHINRFVHGEKTYSDGSRYVGHLTESYAKASAGKKHRASLRHGFGTLYAITGQILVRGYWFRDQPVTNTGAPHEAPPLRGPDDEDILI